LSSAREAVKRGSESVNLKYLYCWKLFVRERLAKTKQAGKGLRGAVLICDLWRLTVAL
jgi:hypothetical protein